MPCQTATARTDSPGEGRRRSIRKEAVVGILYFLLVLILIVVLLNLLGAI